MDLELDAGLLTRLERRMQYVLGPRPVQVLPSWRSTVVAGGLHLNSHPDLKVTTVEVGDVTLTLLGFLLDPERPGASDRELLDSVAEAVAKGGTPFAALARLGGRYLLIVDHGTVTVVGDAAGTMQLFFARAEAGRAVQADASIDRPGEPSGSVGGETWCAAQSDLLAQQLGFGVDPQAVEFIELAMSNPEYAWPADSSPYTEVRRLLPNHFLDLTTGDVTRYWPNARLPLLELAEQSIRVAERLSGLIAAGSKRFDLALGISAGVDSRLMLAASRGVKDDVIYYTGQDEARDFHHPDVAIPRAMLSAGGAIHHIIESGPTASVEFEDVFRRSVPYAHMHRAPALEAQLARYRLGRVAAVGNVSEISRSYYRTQASPAMPREGLTPAFCARLASLDHPFARSRFERWLGGLGETYGIDPRDLLYWETRTGNWFAQNVSEFVIGWGDVFLPYSCRALLVDMISVPDEVRIHPSREVYRAATARLWPELLDFPINPVPRIEQVRRRLKRQLRRVKRRLVG